MDDSWRVSAPEKPGGGVLCETLCLLTTSSIHCSLSVRYCWKSLLAPEPMSSKDWLGGGKGEEDTVAL